MSDTTSGSTSGAQRTLAEAKAEVASNLALMPILQGIIGNQYLSGTAAPTPTDASAFVPATLNLFSGSSVPHLPFYIEQVKPASLFANNNTASMTEESTVSYTFPKLGEYVGMPQVLIVAPALITYTSTAVDIAGETGTDTSSDIARFLVEDLHHSQFAIRKYGNSTANVTYSSSSGPLQARMFKLSRYLELTCNLLPSLSSAPVTAPVGFLGGRDYFPSEDAMCAYCQYAPIYLLRETIFKIQDAQQDIFGPQFILAWHRVWASPESVPRDELFHGSNDPSQLRVWSAMSQRQWVVTLPMWWGVGGFSQYLANRALHNHDIKFEFKFAPLKSIIVGSNAHVDILTGFGTHTTYADPFVCKTTSTGALPLNGMPIATYNATLPSTAIAASLFAFYFTFHRVWLNGDIRRMLHASSGKKLAVLHNKIQTGTITNALGLAGTALTYEFTPILSTAAYFWTVIRQSQVVQNKQMNFGGPRNPLYAACNETGEVMSLLNSLEIAQENSEVVWSQTAFWANKVAPHVFAARNRIPDGWYLKNWGIGSPYSLQKRGFANLSALGKLKMTLNPNMSAFADLTAVGGVALESVTYNHFAYTYNSFSWGGGMGGKDWSNGSS